MSGVFVYHVAYFAELGPRASPNFAAVYGASLGNALRTLDASVFVFFVLSGYLIGRPFVVALVHARRQPRLGSYLRNRLLRIVPLFWTVVTALLLLGKGGGTSTTATAGVYLFGQNFDPKNSLTVYVGPAWTLDIEMTFYLALPVLCWLLAHAARAVSTERRRRAALLGIFGLAAAASMVAESRLQAYEWRLSLVCVGFAFVPGLALAVIEEPAVDLLGKRPDVAKALAAVLLLAGAVGLVLYAGIGPPDAYPPRPGLRSSLSVCAASGCLVAAALVGQWGGLHVPRIVDNPATRWLGERSYSIYLLHQAVLLELFDRGWLPADGQNRRLVVLLGAALLITLPLAELTHRLIERPFLSLRSSVPRRPLEPSFSREAGSR